MCQSDQLHTCCKKRQTQRFTQDRSKLGVGSSCGAGIGTSVYMIAVKMVILLLTAFLC